MGEIGSLKNRIKQWRKNRKRIKEEKEKQQQEQFMKKEKEQQKKSKLKILSLAVLGFGFALLETILKPVKRETPSLPKKKVASSLRELKVEIKEIKTSFQKLETKKKEFSKKENKAKLKEEYQVLQESFQRVAKKKEIVEKELILPLLSSKVTYNEKKVPKKKRNKEQVQSKALLEEYRQIEQEFHDVKMEFETLEETFDQEILVNETEKEIGSDQKVESKTVIKSKDERSVLTPAKELEVILKMLNYDCRKLNQELEQIIQNSTDKKETYGKLCVLSHKIYYYSTIERDNKKKLPFEDYKNNLALSKLDPFHFLTKRSVFDELLESCEHAKWNLEKQPNDTIIEKKKIKPVHQEKIQKISFDYQRLATEIKHQQLHLEALEQNLRKLPPLQKKKGKLALLTSFIKNSALIPLGVVTGLAFFSPVSILTGLVITNHGIRGMRNLGKNKEDKEVYWDLKNLLGQITEEKDVLNFSLHLCKDSLIQIQQFKQEFLLEYGNQTEEIVINFYNQLMELELSVLSQKQEIERRQLQLQEEYEKGKEKVKRLEERI